MGAALCTAMVQTLATNEIKKKILKLDCSPLCRPCQQTDETIHYTVSTCPKLAGTKYTEHHNNVMHYIHWNLLHKRGIKSSTQ
eukprot:4215176-Ditylum_brightwellii.AAC.1